MLEYIDEPLIEAEERSNLEELEERYSIGSINGTADEFERDESEDFYEREEEDADFEESLDLEDDNTN